MDVAASTPRTPFFAERFADLLNRAIAADEKTAHRLRELGACAIGFKLKGSGETFVLNVDDGIVGLARGDGSADVTITGRPSDFIALARAQRDSKTLPAGRLQIEGDLARAQQIQAILNNISFDIEALIAPYTGDLVARQVGRGAGAAARLFRRTHETLERQLSDYLLYEVRLLPNATELETFIEHGIALGADVDRLAARLDRLKRRKS